MNKKALTITIVANMTSNYSESLGNIASVQKVFRNRKVYTIRSRESLKNAIMTQSGLYEDLKTEIDGAVQKKVTEESNASNCRALEGGYMNTSGTTYIRNSSFYVTDAISCESFVSQPRFHNNLYMATNYAKENGLNVQNHADQVGLMPYQYEYDKSLKIYSITIDLEMVGKDDNFQEEAEAEELFRHPSHPYTRALLSAIPTTGDSEDRKLSAIPGMVPENYDTISGCRFADRCPYTRQECHQRIGLREISKGHTVRCILQL